MDLAKVGGIYWSAELLQSDNVKKKKTVSSISPLEKTDSINDFKIDVKLIKSSNSMEKMVNVKRTKKKRQFMDEITK